jgi:hypothetical protein
MGSTWPSWALSSAWTRRPCTNCWKLLRGFAILLSTCSETSMRKRRLRSVSDGDLADAGA